MNRFMMLGVLTLGVVCGGVAHAATGQRVVVPVRQETVKSGGIRYSVSISIGHTRLRAMLDTGSTGIRILPGATSPSDLTPTQQDASYSYSSGVKLTGVLANALVAVGNLRGTQPISIDDVTHVGCIRGRPHCAASRVSQQAYRLGGRGNRGFKAIMGISLAPSTAVNPLPAIGAPTWILILPKPGDTQPGSLILNPNPADLAGFTDFQLNTSRKPIQALPGCLVNLRSNQKVCAPTILDSGTMSVNVKMPSNNQGLSFTRGDQAQFTFKGRAGSVPPATFTVTARGLTRVSVKIKQAKHGQPPTSIMGGILPYFSYDVLYDSGSKVIGLKPRMPARGEILQHMEHGPLH